MVSFMLGVVVGWFGGMMFVGWMTRKGWGGRLRSKIVG